MITLTLDEDKIIKDDQVISDLPSFLASLPKFSILVLIIKSHDAAYFHCPIQKAARFIKSGEFSSDHWVGEKRLLAHPLLKYFHRGQVVIGGILPTSIMRKSIQLISEYSFALKGSFAWADLIVEAYNPLPQGWVIIWHEHQVLVCNNQILRFSRPCYLPFVQELPSLLRYIKRFGYEVGMPITILSIESQQNLPEYIQLEIRSPKPIKSDGMTLAIPEAINLYRRYLWPRIVQTTLYFLVILNVLGLAYLGMQVKRTYEEFHVLKNHVERASAVSPVNESKIEAFDQYRRLIKSRHDPLVLLRRLAPLIKDEAVATYLHWTPKSLVLHLEVNPTTVESQLLLALRSHFQDYHVTWNREQGDSLKGVLMLENTQRIKPSVTR